MDENYQEAFDQLFLYDDTSYHLTDGTSLGTGEAQELYMEKISYLKDINYKVQGFEIDNVRYEDGHTFFLELTITVARDGEVHEYAETIDIWEDKSELLPPLTTLTGCLKWGLLG
ncbi:hypothetical protein ACM26V_03835 [Salipaludibacillus sp. HK11]|uniref:hypothetical protein n=1 Tax=Salipaludibacillus sp. HK11 TaxID=3394320 RepID=UPI0039FD2568